MKRWPVGVAAAIGAAGVAGAAMVLKGILHGVDDLQLEKQDLFLAGWPEHLAGFKIAVLADLHLGGPYSVRRAKLAAHMAIDTQPDLVALVGDYVNVWQPDSAAWIGEALEPLRAMEGAVVAVPGNHDYQLGDPELLAPIFKELQIHLLRNETWQYRDVTWVGVDSAVEEHADPERAMRGVASPAVCLWHEPDLVEYLPAGCQLMLSGHAHGGQGRLLRRYKPVKTYLGSKYVEGFFHDAPTPLYVSRGVGTTLFPLRIDVPPEVTLLSLFPA